MVRHGEGNDKAGGPLVVGGRRGHPKALIIRHVVTHDHAHGSRSRRRVDGLHPVTAWPQEEGIHLPSLTRVFTHKPGGRSPKSRMRPSSGHLVGPWPFLIPHP